MGFLYLSFMTAKFDSYTNGCQSLSKKTRIILLSSPPINEAQIRETLRFWLQFICYLVVIVSHYLETLIEMPALLLNRMPTLLLILISWLLITLWNIYLFSRLYCLQPLSFTLPLKRGHIFHQSNATQSEECNYNWSHGGN